MKLDWALGGEFLVRQTPLPPEARAELLARSGGTVTAHWESVALALVGTAAALHLSGRFRPHGRLRRAVLLCGAWAGCVFMVARAVGILGYGFIGDLRLLTGLASVAPADPELARTLAYWDLLLWSPYWLLFGLCWGIAAHRYAHAAKPGSERTLGAELGPGQGVRRP
ncbi:hypothetical protein [Streptomyces sp. NPDC048269]|uniref:hypothetical protein n=1 Tax=Streptomyces sp. NPDC048269 TaxID=3155753 RepID=UPI00342E385D